MDNSLVGTDHIALTLSGDAQLLQVAPATDTGDRPVQNLSLALYDDLSEMPTHDDQQRSMFDQRGLMRVAGPPVHMLGQHPAINADQQAFDDPQLLDSVFNIDPQWLESTKPQACHEKLAQRSQQ